MERSSPRPAIVLTDSLEFPFAPPRTGRVMLGATDPLKSDPGSIRGAYALEVGRNVCHGSDTVENAQKEIKLWFPEGLNSWTSAAYKWVYEK